MSSRTGVRAAIVGIFAVLATAVAVAEVRSQPGRPGGFTGRPGGVSGVGGMPGGMAGRRAGGITGMGGMPRPGGITGVGGMPGPGGVTGVPAPGGFGGGPRFEEVWYCGKCKAELGRGPVKPSHNSCPRCGVRFINGGGGGGGFGLVAPPAVPSTPGFTTPRDPDLTPRNATGSSGIFPPASTPAAGPGSGGNSGSNSPASTDRSSGAPSKTGTLILKIVIGVFGFLFLLGVIGGTVLIIAANKAPARPARRRPRRALDLDDDD